MGVDCYLFDGKNYHGLDRWYVFEDLVESEKEYTKAEITSNLNILSDNITRFISDVEWGEIRLSSKGYYMRWIMEAKEFVTESESDCFIFYTDTNMPDEFYEQKPE